ncbi:hypothetical protein [Brucella abortus]|uniref:hypothetical protein n=1 Tax=Brucella abortus TaxID=235 RepID=UPI0031FC792A
MPQGLGFIQIPDLFASCCRQGREAPCLAGGSLIENSATAVLRPICSSAANRAHRIQGAYGIWRIDVCTGLIDCGIVPESRAGTLDGQ